MGCAVAYPEPEAEREASAESGVSLPTSTQKKNSSDPDLEPPRLYVSTAVGKNTAKRVLKRKEERTQMKARNLEQMKSRMQTLEDMNVSGTQQSFKREDQTTTELRETQQYSEVRAYDGTDLRHLSRSDE